MAGKYLNGKTVSHCPDPGNATRVAPPPGQCARATCHQRRQPRACASRWPCPSRATCCNSPGGKLHIGTGRIPNAEKPGAALRWRDRRIAGSTCSVHPRHARGAGAGKVDLPPQPRMGRGVAGEADLGRGLCLRRATLLCTFQAGRGTLPCAPTRATRTVFSASTGSASREHPPAHRHAPFEKEPTPIGHVAPRAVAAEWRRLRRCCCCCCCCCCCGVAGGVGDAGGWPPLVHGEGVVGWWGCFARWLGSLARCVGCTC